MRYLDLSIEELHALLVKGEVTPLDLTKEALELAKNDTNNAFQYPFEKRIQIQIYSPKGVKTNPF